jgi:hypothetical protein
VAPGLCSWHRPHWALFPKQMERSQRHGLTLFLSLKLAHEQLRSSPLRTTASVVAVRFGTVGGADEPTGKHEFAHLFEHDVSGTDRWGPRITLTCFTASAAIATPIRPSRNLLSRNITRTAVGTSLVAQLNGWVSNSGWTRFNTGHQSCQEERRLT